MSDVTLSFTCYIVKTLIVKHRIAASPPLRAASRPGYGDPMRPVDTPVDAPTDADVDTSRLEADIPPGRLLHVPGRGDTWVRLHRGPRGAPTVVLLHGWLATGALNWFRCFGELGRHFTLVVPDLRGHGRGIRSRRRFRLRDCADDTAATLELLDTGPVIAVGYSMGGPVAQLLWRHHRHLVSGLVLSATGAEFVPGNRERYALSALGTVAAGTTRLGSLAAWLPGRVTRTLFGMELSRRDPGALARWARHEMSHHSVRVLFEALHAIANYSARSWIHEIDVPTSVLVTDGDRAVSPEAQLRMARSITDARVDHIADGHAACVNPVFGHHVTTACLDVAARVPGHTRAHGTPTLPRARADTTHPHPGGPW